MPIFVNIHMCNAINNVYPIQGAIRPVFDRISPPVTITPADAMNTIRPGLIIAQANS